MNEEMMKIYMFEGNDVKYISDEEDREDVLALSGITGIRPCVMGFWYKDTRLSSDATYVIARSFTDALLTYQEYSTEPRGELLETDKPEDYHSILGLIPYDTFNLGTLLLKAINITLPNQANLARNLSIAMSSEAKLTDDESLSLYYHMKDILESDLKTRTGMISFNTHKRAINNMLDKKYLDQLTEDNE